MPLDPAVLSSRLTSLRARVEKAAARSGRSLSDITLVAVTKTVPPPLIREAHRLGVGHFGWNRVQEAADKIPALADLKTPAWHFIGHLQTNKAGKAVDLFECVQSVDSERVADALNRAAAKAEKVLPCLIEVKTSSEPGKGGLLPQALDGLLDGRARWPWLAFEGLMTLAPHGDPGAARSCFRHLRELGDRHSGVFGERYTLSMGMSDDFEAAVEEGSTMIRIGTALFGERA